MIIVIVVATVISAACLAEVARRAYLGRRTVRDMQWHKLPSTIATLLTAQETQNAVRHERGRAPHDASGWHARRLLRDCRQLGLGQ